MRARPPTLVVAGLAITLVAALLGVVSATSTAEPPAPEPPFAAVQWGTNGCIEVGVRPAPPYNQPLPELAPADYNLLAGYPDFGYDTTGYTTLKGTNSCRYNFRDASGNTIGSGYCVEWAAGQRTGTGYDPEPWDGTIDHAGYVRRILTDNWPATNLPTLSTTNATVANRQRSGVVAMAIHYFTDGIVMPPDYQVRELYDAVDDVVTRALRDGPVAAPDPRPAITGPVSGLAGVLTGPYTLGANAEGEVTVVVSGGEAFLDAAGTQPFTSGGSVPPGTELWVRSATAGNVVLDVSAVLEDPVGTLMVGDPTYPVQSMGLAGEPLNLLGKNSRTIPFDSPPLEPSATSQVSAHDFELGGSVTDTFTVTGLGPTGTANLDVTLYGPVAVPAAGCTAAPWAAGGLPVARLYPPIALTGDQVVATDPTPLLAPGCYSYGAVLTPTTGDAFTMPPGDPPETLRVVPATVILPWRVTSHASSSRIGPGGKVSDRITVRNLGAGRVLTVRPALLGPVSPVDGSCRKVRWTRLHPDVAVRFQPVQQTGSGTITTPSARPKRPGCYTFVANVTNGFQTGGLVAAPHGYGNRHEVVQVFATTPRLHTHTARDRITPGQRLVDRVHVTGLAQGTSAPATARLYGPFASRAATRCRAAHQAAAVTWRVHNGQNTSPPVRVHEPGIYTWRVTTRATDRNGPGRHACGLASETTTVAKPAYGVPSVVGGYSGTLPGYPPARSATSTVTGPAFGLRAPITPTGVSAGRMDLPAEVGTVAWLRSSAAAGDKIGTTVIAGHVSDRHDRPGALWALSRAERGDLVTVTRGRSHQRYRVVTTATYDRTRRLPQRLFSTTGAHRLVLVSCTGRVVDAAGRFHYTRYRVVVAEPRGR